MATSDGVVGQLALLFGGCCARVKSAPSSPRAQAAAPPELEAEETQLKLPDDDLPAQVLSARRSWTPKVEEPKDVDSERLEHPGDGSCSTIDFVNEVCELTEELDASWAVDFSLGPEHAGEECLHALRNQVCEPQAGIDVIDFAAHATDDEKPGLAESRIEDTTSHVGEDVTTRGLLAADVHQDGPDGPEERETDVEFGALLEVTAADCDASLDDSTFYDCLEFLEVLDASTESAVCGLQEDAQENEAGLLESSMVLEHDEQQNDAPVLRWKFITSRNGNKTIGEKEFQFFEECLRGLKESIAYYGMDAPLHEMDLYEAEEMLRYMLQEWFRQMARHGGDTLFVERRRFMSFGTVKVLELLIWCTPVEQMYVSVEWPWNVRVESA
mmetsp:Transcript_12631/g.28694  ORF Transcript_12631/g.28694 Transcript_12631/m.28694 type:complete len:385 (+) Transcript_12631:47-1201(+)